MKVKLLLPFFLLSLIRAQPPKTPAAYWSHLSDKEKVTFVNGAYAMAAQLKKDHQHQVNHQFVQQPGWTEPYFVERYYEIIDEYISQNVNYNLRIITQNIDALYANSDNANIPLMEALHIVSLAQDGNHEKANLLLLQAQRKHK